jgi:hypothetical protein
MVLISGSAIETAANKESLFINKLLEPKQYELVWALH